MCLCIRCCLAWARAIREVCVAKLRHAVGFVVGGYSDLLGLKVGLHIAKAGKGKTKYGKTGYTDEQIVIETCIGCHSAAWVRS